MIMAPTLDLVWGRNGCAAAGAGHCYTMPQGLKHMWKMMMTKSSRICVV